MGIWVMSKVDIKFSDKDIKLIELLLYMVRQQSNCDRLHVGCVLLDTNKATIGIGANHSLTGDINCDTSGHVLEDGHCIRTIHAEINALSKAFEISRMIGIQEPYAAFVTNRPCVTCLKDLVAFGFKEIHWFEDDLHKYNDYLIKSIMPDDVIFSKINN